MTENSPILAKKFTCNYCDYNCSKESDYNKHLLTRKHQRNDTSTPETHKTEYKCTCGKTYKFRQGLSLHKKKCTQITNEQHIINVYKLDDKNTIDLQKLYFELQKQTFELQTQNYELHKQLIEIYKNSKCL